MGAAVLCGAWPVAAQEPPTLEVLWALIQQQQAEINELRRQLGAAQSELSDAGAVLETTQEIAVATADYVESLEIVTPSESATTIGGYGELHYNRVDADDDSGDFDEIDFHRFVLFFGHEFSDRVRFFSELELEHSIAGDGQPGEAELEQAYIDFSINDNLSAQGGLFLVPVGILNETHEPPTFYGVERNPVENIIIPSTWWEAGAGLSGTSAAGISWNLAAHSGLAMPTTGSSAFRVRSGRQKVGEADARNPAYTARIRYTGIPGLDLSASYQYQTDPSQVPGDGLDSGNLFSAHAIYSTGNFSLRTLYGAWSFDGAAVEAAGADEQSGWFVEPSYRLSPEWGIYARYLEIDAARSQDRFSEWEAGLSYFPVPRVAVKIDFRSREHDLLSMAGRDFSAIDLGIGYHF
ncbi:MAG TPA: porin [Gammaproteobacteria bacterium]